MSQEDTNRQEEVEGGGDSRCASVMPLSTNQKITNYANSPSDRYNDEHGRTNCDGGTVVMVPIATRGAAKPAVSKPSQGSLIRANLRRFGLTSSGNKSSNHSECGKTNSNKCNGVFIIIGALAFIFMASFIGFVVMWFTNVYNNTILENLILSNGSQAIKLWQEPPVDPYLRIHIFNYTNTERWLKGEDEKLHVEDVGPYVYKEKFEKVDLQFNDNFTISYKENRTYEFLPNESKGLQTDKIIFPNVVLLTVVAKLKEMNVFFQYSLNNLMFLQKAFKKVQAHELIWGYNDELLNGLKNFDSSIRLDKFGMLVTRKGVSEETITIFTGEDDIDKLSVINRFNGTEKMNFWTTDECNRIDGTDGSQFPPYYMDKKRPLHIFSKAFCRKFPLYFDSEVNILDGVPAWRYKAPLNVFASPDINPSNQCFCDLKTGECPTSGVFDVSKCFDAPILLSFPHFFTGDNSLFEILDGLNPVEDLHRSYADVHPRLAFPIGGASRVQINVQVQAIDVVALKKFKVKQILPVIWMEIVSGAISTELRTLIYHSTFSTNALQLCLNYGTLLLSATSLTLLILMVRYSQRTDEEHVVADDADKAATPVPSVPFASDTEQPESGVVSLSVRNGDPSAKYFASSNQGPYKMCDEIAAKVTI